MNTLKVSATKARNNFFELLNQVALGTQVIIERDSKEIAYLSPKQKMDWRGLRKAMREAHGILKDYDPLDNPLRRPGAERFLGRIDRVLLKSKQR